ncbi:unnamed protein product [Dimorphilus gyrociliatus]|uniref:Uncharacterized protein n=1 Tax=Dimorphilus gyrociliatus TaxID=2664684 RepID=A0A7I8VS42_9ANNE|nr:unnamed protein product [Dimorphilus gyrociliatus]
MSLLTSRSEVSRCLLNEELDLSLLKPLTTENEAESDNKPPEDTNSCDDFEMQTFSDSSTDEEADKYNEYYFESDALVYRDCKDYRKLLSTMAILEAQKVQALKDIDYLANLKRKAIENPTDFCKELQKESIKIPKFQNIWKVPKIEWSKYETSLEEDRIREKFEMEERTKEKERIFLEREGHVATKEEVNEEEESDDSKQKTVSYKQPWTELEQRKLEELLTIYPSEEVEARRWEKIARALGNRTTLQVQSRVQKYFIKLAKSGLPIPGRVPNVTNTFRKIKPRAKFLQQALNLNSTFMTSYQLPPALKNEPFSQSVKDEPDREIASETETSKESTTSKKEENELNNLIKLKENILKEVRKNNDSVHRGYECSKCKQNPIRGVRWSCKDCSPSQNVNLCSTCANDVYETPSHSIFHSFDEILFPLQIK